MCEKLTGYLDLGVNTEQGEKNVHVYQRLPGLSVDCAQKVEREGELEEQAVHHHQVSNRHRSFVRATKQLAAGWLPLSHRIVFEHRAV